MLKKEDSYQYLPQLYKSVPKDMYGYRVSPYSVILEGWRRGLELKFYKRLEKPKGKYVFPIFEFSDGNRTHKFTSTRGDLVTKEAIKICINKHTTKEILQKNGVPTPEGKAFNKESTDEEIIEYAKKIGFPAVLKPTNGAGGKGVISNIKSNEDFIKALKYVKYELGYKDIIVEQYFNGEDIRVYVVGEKVIGAIKRVSPTVVGNGIDNIMALIAEKNNQRNKIPALYNNPIKIDQEVHELLAQQGYDVKSIPKYGETVIIKEKSNISSGGDPYDVTDLLTPEMKETAIRATQVVPGLVQSGVDLLVDFKNNNSAVIELNSRPSIRTHLYPINGRARDIPKAIIDYYFPDSKQLNYKESKPLYYFDMKRIMDTLSNSYIEEVKVENYPIENQGVFRFILKNAPKKEKFIKWIQKQATSLKLNGYLKFFKDNKSVIVIAGDRDAIVRYKKRLYNKVNKSYNDVKIIQKDRKSPVNLGFKIISANQKDE